MRRSILIASISLLLATGCASVRAPTEAEMAVADYGAEPQHYLDSIHAYFNQTLKDPASIQYRLVTMPEHGYTHFSNAFTGRTLYGWLVRAEINAKNSYGGYTGFQTYQFLFRGDQLVNVTTPDD